MSTQETALRPGPVSVEPNDLVIEEFDNWTTAEDAVVTPTSICTRPAAS
ncbi:hypothetical protein ACFPZ0_24350 [Streptomonospora nanhaiensis]|uniref:Uncharacterized protein n=1 Tax=Streptomonospora nanhaiensis TaxID=1323731 RepID=A0A853BVR6_9ACTN|nr:hypothetical protein [Streptomonospora nanhaiensis]MBX9391278.1 hypothetical protein [Streptomonospora nanhaiensis]NYI99070.1 hypothetical protein [Streptomonospora nanhaiensis]